MANELAITEGTSIATVAGYELLPVQQIQFQTEQVKQLMANCMKEGQHYGKVPGCGDKPTLLKPGAQKLNLMFGLADTYEVKREDLPNGHREYTVTCTLVSKHTGIVQGSGMGLCTTMEKKYRYRNVSDYEILDEPIPQDAKERKQEYRKQGFGMKKVDGLGWVWVKYKDSAQQENPDIADTYNTVLKMAEKRALVEAVTNTLAVSDLFTQDIEDLGSYAIDYTPHSQQRPKQPAQKSQAEPSPEVLAWRRVKSLKEQALAAGVKESGLTSWAEASILDIDGNPKKMNQFSLEEINAFATHIEACIRSTEELDNEVVSEPVDVVEVAPLYDENIPF